jgi:hypothetical protein
MRDGNSKQNDSIDDLLDVLGDDTSGPTLPSPPSKHETWSGDISGGADSGGGGAKTSGKCFPVYLGGTDCELVQDPYRHRPEAACTP